MGIASANPTKLEEAAAAVPADVKNALDLAVTYGHLAHKIEQFDRCTQDPFRVLISTESLVGALAEARAKGNELDTRLVRIAAEFRRAGGYPAAPRGWDAYVAAFDPSTRIPDGRRVHAPGFPDTRYMDDAALQAGLNQWGLDQGPEFRQRDDGVFEMSGPDGNWYVVVGSPPQGVPPLASTEGTIDFENPQYGIEISAGVINGFLGYTYHPLLRAPDRDAYEHIHFDENGIPIIDPSMTASSEPVPDPPLGYATPGDYPHLGYIPPNDPARRAPQVVPQQSRAGIVQAAAGAIKGGVEHADAKNINIARTSTTFYLDPVTGQRVAVVNAAGIRYEESGDAVVSWGRLSIDRRGRLRVIRRPADPSEPSVPGPGVENATEIRIPGGGDD